MYVGLGLGLGYDWGYRVVRHITSMSGITPHVGSTGNVYVLKGLGHITYLL